MNAKPTREELLQLRTLLGTDLTRHITDLADTGGFTKGTVAVMALEAVAKIGIAHNSGLTFHYLRSLVDVMQIEQTRSLSMGQLADFEHARTLLVDAIDHSINRPRGVL